VSAPDPDLRYIERLFPVGDPVLAEIAEEQDARADAAPSIGPHVGAFLVWLVRVLRARRVLELGTCLGYSTVVLAGALKETGGRLTAVEIDPGFRRDTARRLEQAGVASRVELIEGDAGRVLLGLEGPYDLILQDSAKPLYPRLLDRCVELLRTGGVLAADDALFPPHGVREELSAPIHEFNERVFADPRLLSTILPIGDGLTLSVKR
jgi:predicted O-methyltransferase YrrM